MGPSHAAAQYPKVVHELAGWTIRAISAGAATYAAAASQGSEISTITWCGSRLSIGQV